MSTRFAQDFEVEVQERFWSWSLVSISLLLFVWGYEVEYWSKFYCWVEILKLSLVMILNFKLSRNADVLLGFWRWNLINTFCPRRKKRTFLVLKKKVAQWFRYIENKSSWRRNHMILHECNTWGTRKEMFIVTRS